MEQPTFLLVNDLFTNFCENPSPTATEKEVEKLERFTKAFVFCWNQIPSCPAVPPEINALRGCEYISRVLQFLRDDPNTRQDYNYFRKLGRNTVEKNIATLENYGVTRQVLLNLEKSVWTPQTFFPEVESIFQTLNRNKKTQPRHLTLLALMGILLLREDATGRNLKAVNPLNPYLLLFTTETGFQSLDVGSGRTQTFDLQCAKTSQGAVTLCDDSNSSFADPVVLNLGEFAFRCEESQGKLVKMKPYTPNTPTSSQNVENTSMRREIYQNADIVKRGEIVFPSFLGVRVVNFQTETVRAYGAQGLLEEQPLVSTSDTSHLKFGSIMYSVRTQAGGRTNMQMSLVQVARTEASQRLELTPVREEEETYNLGAL